MLWMIKRNVMTPAGSPLLITEGAVAKSLSRLKPNKATGPDGLKARLLRDHAPQMNGFLSRLLN